MSKNAMINFRTTPAEATVLREMMKREHLNISEFIRILIRAEAKRQNLWPPKAKLENTNGENG